MGSKPAFGLSNYARAEPGQHMSISYPGPIKVSKFCPPCHKFTNQELLKVTPTTIDYRCPCGHVLTVKRPTVPK